MTPRHPGRALGRYVRATGYKMGRRWKPPGKPEPRGAHAFEARVDGTLVIYASMPDGDGEPIHIEPHRVKAVLAACADALAGKRSMR